jgi:adenosylcobinamide-GDP ribazoletransferase
VVGGFVTAFRTLTILPVPGRDTERFENALPWFPVVGLVLGGILYALAMVLDVATLYMWPIGVAFGLICADAVLTRGLHLDGVADVADALGAIRDRPKALSIMKDPRVGTFGVVALLLITLGKLLALARIVQNGDAAWIVLAFTVSRTAIVDWSVSLPYARPEGGMAGGFVEGARGIHRFGAFMICLIVCGGIAGPIGLGVVLIGWIVSALYKRWARLKFGGITGDLLGAGTELVTLAILLFGAAWGFTAASWMGWPLTFLGCR